MEFVKIINIKILYANIVAKANEMQFIQFTFSIDTYNLKQTHNLRCERFQFILRAHQEQSS